MSERLGKSKYGVDYPPQNKDDTGTGDQESQNQMAAAFAKAKEGLGEELSSGTTVDKGRDLMQSKSVSSAARRMLEAGRLVRERKGIASTASASKDALVIDGDVPVLTDVVTESATEEAPFELPPLDLSAVSLELPEPEQLSGSVGSEPMTALDFDLTEPAPDSSESAFKPPYDFHDVNELWDTIGVRPRAEDVETYARITDEKEREAFRESLRIVEQGRQEQEASKEVGGRGHKRASDLYEDFPRAGSLNFGEHLLPELVTEPVVTEETKKEQRSKLRELVSKLEVFNKVFERGVKKDFEWWKSSEESLIRRSKDLDVELEKIGGVERGFRWIGEKYNKLDWKTKLAVGASLGVGTALTAGTLAVAFPLLGIAAQRIAGLSTMYLKYEKNSHEGEWGREKAMLKAGVYTVVLGLAMKEAIEYASQTSLAHAAQAKVEGWLGNMLGHHTVAVSAGTSEGVGAAAPAPVQVVEAPVAEAPASVVQEAPQPAAAAVETHVAPVHHEAVVAKMVVAPESASVPADTSTGSPITEGQNIRIEDDIRQRALASVASLDQGTPAEAAAPVATAEVSAATPETQAPAVSVEAPVAAQPLEVIQTPPPIETIVAPEAPVATIDATPVQEQNFAVDSSGNAILDSEGQPVHTGVFEPAPGTNAFGIEVKADVPHVYADAAGQHLFVFGGSPAERAKSILDFLTQNPDKVVFAADDSGKYRIPWHMLEGKVTPGAPMRTSGFFGFFSDFMKAPEPNELAKLIK